MRTKSDQGQSVKKISMHPAAVPPEILLANCQESRTRRSGPGGQHRNKVETAVILRHLPTGISAEASERRSQAENRRIAVERLRTRLAIEHRLPPASSGPSVLWQSRTHNRRIVISTAHADYPALLAEALDALNAVAYDLPLAAAFLAVSP